jgi:hypothetical protein
MALTWKTLKIRERVQRFLKQLPLGQRIASATINVSHDGSSAAVTLMIMSSHTRPVMASSPASSQVEPGTSIKRIERETLANTTTVEALLAAMLITRWHDASAGGGRTLGLGFIPASPGVLAPQRAACHHVRRLVVALASCLVWRD